MKKLIFFVVLVDWFTIALPQNIDYVKNIITELCSEQFHGRGYVNNGDSIAAEYIASLLEKDSIQKFNNSYFQYFSFPINTFPSEMEVILSDTLAVGVDFLVKPFSSSCKGTYKILWLDAKILKNQKKIAKIKNKHLRSTWIVLDTVGLNDTGFKNEYNNIIINNSLNAMGIIIPEDGKLTHAVSQEVKNHTVLSIRRTKISKKEKKITINVKHHYKYKHRTQNVIAFIEGEIDSFFVFSAHYDHLGRLGTSTYFPGAHDNASGTAMVLDLIRHFKQSGTKPKYSLAFMFFAAEEAGLLGSEFYTRNPFFPLRKIKFLFNLDMLGSGENGITLVNGSVFKEATDKLIRINDEKKYVKEIKLRGKAANSDHYFFFEKNVPCFFLYTLGEYSHYHNIYDKASTLPLNAYENIFKLLTDFIEY